MADQSGFEEYTGFTEPEVRQLCQRFNMDFEMAKSWYDGYVLTGFQHIYNPKSVVEAMRRHKSRDSFLQTIFPVKILL